MSITGHRAVLYLRLSKEDLDKEHAGDDSNSIRNQQMLLTDYALGKNFHIVDIYKDDNYSGLFDSRPGFEKLIQDAKERKFDVIIAKSQSRFTRNMEHLERYMHNDFLIWGIRFIGVVDHVDTSVTGNKKARQINGLVNEWYSEELSNNIRAVFKIKMQEGQYIGASTPYGYIKNPQNKHQLIIDEYAAGIVRRIFNLYLSGYGKGKIGAILSAEGILIPSDYKVEVLGQNYYNAKKISTTKLWSYQTIHSILNNETYLGHTIQNKCSSPSYKSKQKKALPQSQWIRVENTHEPIIDTITFEKAKKLMQVKTRKLYTTDITGLFAGCLVCFDCKHAMIRSYSKKGFDGYICRIYKAHGNKFCTSHKISEDKLTAAVLKTLKQQAKEILQADDIATLSVDNSKNKQENKLQEQKLLQKKQELQETKFRAYEDYTKDIISLEEYQSFKEKLLRMEEETQEKLLYIRNIYKNKKEEQQKNKEWIDKFKNYMNVETLTRHMVIELIDKIEIMQDNKIQIHFKFSNTHG